MLQALYEADGPISADELTARSVGSDLSSVYRNLEVLEEIGLVRHVHLGHGPGLYALAIGNDVEFVTCEGCGTLEALEPRRLDAAREEIERQSGFVARFTHFPIVGICPACQSAPLEDAHHHAHP